PKEKGRARVRRKGGGVRHRAPPRGEERPAGAPPRGPPALLTRHAHASNVAAVDKGPAYRHATFASSRGSMGPSRDEELPFPDDRLAVGFDGRRAHRAVESERGLVGPADELVPSDPDGDGTPDDRGLK